MSDRQSRPMYWAIRRELWENRSIWMAPLIVTAVVMLVVTFSTIGLPKRVQNLSSLDPARRQVSVAKPFNMAPAPIMATTLLVGLFYCIDALYGERRDRSIQFWKSLPVSDRTTVLSKASIPMVVLPLIAWALSVIAQLFLLLVSSAVVIGHGVNPIPLWRELHFMSGLPVMIYGLAVHALWFAPLYGWLLMISAWAKRAPVLWAVLPLLAPVMVERMVSTKHPYGSFLMYRLGGAMGRAFSEEGQRSGDFDLSQLTPVKFLLTPGLWLGLIAAAVFIAVAIRLRRDRQPI